MSMLSVQDLTKIYNGEDGQRSTTALNGISFEVDIQTIHTKNCTSGGFVRKVCKLRV